ncbi:Ger(x)C family spore germination protein [Bacillus alkalicellulosilyticus]|uniref:Ger(x)C family spore germination protein n=1 Tax=Alkalihalobacterium alkalicellulosilyticum TaxID=1912214 RepID=UPI0009964643|nr:Ger(x)C family spore germination protein [Bacillus alkalicellulosilyticus]
MKRSGWGIIFISLSIISGCVESRIIDELALIYTVGFDMTENDNIELMVTYPSFLEHGEESALFSEILTGESKTMKGALDILDTKAQKPLKLGQVRLLLYSDVIARTGIERYVDTLYRDPVVGNRILLALVEGEMKDIFETADDEQDRVGVLLPDLIHHNIERQVIPLTNLHLFLFSMYNDGRDAFLPIISIDNDEVKIIGTGIFKNDKYVEKINLKESFVLKLLLEKGKGGSQEYSLDNEGSTDYVVVENIHSETMVKVDSSQGTPTFTYVVDMKGEVSDYTGNMNLEDKHNLEVIEQSIVEELQQMASGLIVRFKEKEVDPLGLGERYRSQNRHWDSNEWNEMYSAITVDFDFNVRVATSGVIE